MDVPADTTLGTEMGKVSDIVRPMVESMRGEPMDAAREGEGRRGLGLAERSAGLVEDTAGIAGTDNGLAEASAGVAERSGDEGATFGQRVADKTDSIMDVAAAKLRGAAGGALPDDDAVGDARAPDESTAAGVAHTGPNFSTARGDAPACGDVRGGFMDTGGDASVQRSGQAGTNGERGLARALDYAEKTEDISI